MSEESYTQINFRLKKDRNFRTILISSFHDRYMRYLYPYECDRKGLSTPGELQAAIDGNRREGRRSSYGQFDQSMQGQLQQLVNISLLKLIRRTKF